MTPLTKTLIAAVPVALLAACASAPMTPSPDEASAAPMVYVSSLRSPASITNCLEDRVSRVHASKNGQTTVLAVGSHASYVVTLMPSRTGGSVVRVTHDPSASNDPPEDEMRFHIARCTT